MFNDVDETLKQYLIADLPVSQGELDITFERPTREWSGRLSRPTLNCFLYDIRERSGFRDDTVTKIPDGHGGYAAQRPPRRIDLSYLMTAWAREPEDEHRVLGRTMAAMYRGSDIDERHFVGAMRDSQYPLLTRIAPGDHIAKPADLWGVLDNELHTGIVWIVTAPLDVWVPVEGPLVVSRELRFTRNGDEWRETFTQVAGTVQTAGDQPEAIPGVRVSIAGTAHTAVTRGDGRCSFGNVLPGDHVLRFETSDGKRGEQPIQVPGGSYDIVL
jgi:hypothetical protein